MHEIITLQFGQYSNYLATQFWNVQESYFTYSDQEDTPINHDVHFRAGQAPDGTETYTPRTVIYDLKGGFGSLRKINALYDIQNDTGPVRGLWDGSTSAQQEPPIESSRYQTLLEQGLPTFQLQAHDVRYWSDFNRVFYHPRSAIQLNQYELNSQLMPFESWSSGEELFDQLDKEADLLDRDVRPFAEECDHMQGLQLMTGADDAWGGYAGKYLEALRDEYGKTSIWVWGSEKTERAARHTDMLRSINAARSLRVMGQQASVYVRLATLPSQLPPYVNLSSSSDWITSALICSAMESSTLPTRLTQVQNQPASLSLLEDTLNTNGSQRLVELQLTVQDPSAQNTNGTTNGHVNGTSHTESNEDDEETTAPPPLDISFSPPPNNHSSGAHPHVFAQISTSRTHLPSPSPSPSPNLHPRHHNPNAPIIQTYTTPLLFPQLDSFPHDLFRTTQPGPSLALTTSLSTTSRMKDRVIELRNKINRSLPVDERETMYNDLSELAGGYAYGWESGGEDDDGDDEL